MFKLSYTDDKDFPEFIRLIKQYRWSMLKVVTTEQNKRYFNLKRQRGKTLLQRYHNKNPKRKYDFTIEVVDPTYMQAFIYQKEMINTKTYYNFPELLESELPHQLFKELFEVDRDNVIIDGSGKKERILRAYFNGEDYYLFLNNRFIYAVKQTEFRKIEVPIPNEWEKRLEKYKYLCVDKIRKYGQ